MCIGDTDVGLNAGGSHTKKFGSKENCMYPQLIPEDKFSQNRTKLTSNAAYDSYRLFTAPFFL